MRLEVAALGDGVAVAAVGAGDVVVRPQRQRDADADRLHADVGVGRAAHFARAKQRQRLLVEQANGQHQPQCLTQVQLRGRVGRARLELSRHAMWSIMRFHRKG